MNPHVGGGRCRRKKVQRIIVGPRLAASPDDQAFIFPLQMTKLLQGENRLLPRRFTAADGSTALPVASFTAVEVRLEQKGAVLATHALGTSAALRASAEDPATVILELTTAFTAANKGAIRERWTVSRDNAEFLAEPGKQVDRIVLDDIEIV